MSSVYGITRRILCFSFGAELNVDHMFGVMLDFMSTGDWFYSLRWMPSRFFRTRQGLEDPRSFASYEAHRKLNPNSFEEVTGMTPREYRAR